MASSYLALFGTSLVAFVEAQITPLDCFVGLETVRAKSNDPVGFLFDFDMYPEIFREESYVTYANSGKYVGLKAIEEYVRYVHPSSPFISNSGPGPLETKNGLKGIVGDTCIFTSMAIVRYTYDEGSTGKTNPVDVPVLYHLYFNAIENYISKWIVHYEWGYTVYLFDDVLNTPQVRNHICSIMANECGFDVDLGGGCQARLEALPTFTDGGFLDGNSESCRTLHAVFAESDPAGHCGHIAFDPTPDKDGKIKCQTSELLQSSDFFDADELAQFQAYLEEGGIDPAIGYNILKDDTMQSFVTPSTASPTYQPSAMPTTALPTSQPSATPRKTKKHAQKGKKTQKTKQS